MLLIIVLFFMPVLAQRHLVLVEAGTLTITGNGSDSLKVAFMDTSLLRIENRYKQAAGFTGAATLFLYADTSDTSNSPPDTAGTYTLSLRRLDDQLQSEVAADSVIATGVSWNPAHADRPKIFDIHSTIGIVGYYFYLTRAGATGTASFRFKVLYQRFNR
jgi:hypothetical protein